MGHSPERRTVALVLTHNAPGSLGRCLASIAAQTAPPEAVLVVDNASTPPVSRAGLASTAVPVSIVRSETNRGPAGGWALGFGEFLSSGYTHAWVLDDDMIPEPDCLATLWDRVGEAPDRAFAFPIAIQPDGSVRQWGSWCGYLVSRRIVEVVGLPMEELFWWAEDTEYNAWRIPQAGFPRQIVREAVVHHDAVRQVGEVPTWKYYYEVRNMIYLHLHVMRRVGRFPRNFSLLLGRALVRERRDRLRRAAVVLRAAFDGVTGRLGPRFPVEPLRERSSAGAAVDAEP